MVPPAVRPLYPEEVLAGLSARRIPRAVECHAQVSSTMDVVRERAASGATEGLIVLAETQTAGRGRMGRLWHSPAGQNLYLSLLLRPPIAPPDAFQITMFVAVALCQAIECVTRLAPLLKWPNDVLLPCSPKLQTLGKSAGILVELSLRNSRVEHAIIGCGLNVNSHPPADGGLRYPATSLAAALGEPVDRLRLLQGFLRALDEGYDQLCIGKGDEIFEAWRKRLVTLGNDVRIDTPAGLVTGLAEDVLRSGALIVRDSDGTRHTITTGDVQA